MGNRNLTKVAIGFPVLILVFGWNVVILQGTVDEASQIIAQMEGLDEKGVMEKAERLKSLGREAVPEIEKGLKSENAMVVAGCAEALWELGKATKARKALLSIIANEEDIRAGLLACEILAARAESDMKAEIQELLDDVEDPRLRVGVCRVLAKTGAKLDARRELERLLRNDDAEVRKESALLLGELEYLVASREAVAILKELSREPSQRGRLAKTILEKNELLRVLDERERLKPKRKNQIDTELLEEVFLHIREKYVDEEKVNQQELLHSALKGMVSSLDAYSDFLTEEERTKLEESIELEYAGIGASVSMRDGWLTVESPIIGGAAYEAGIRSFDRIIEVDGERTYGKKLEDLVKKLRGKPGTEVRIKVASDRWTSPQEFVLVRRIINLPVVRTDMLPGGIAYLQLTTFSRDSADKVEEALGELEEDGMKALIFDLRDNSGGYLNAAIEVAGNFLDKGDLLLYTKGRPSIFPREDFRVRSRRAHLEVPIVVLVNRGSASAAEILAGALQDHEKAFLVGTKTFGKGSVQHIYSLKAGGGQCALRLTVMKYYLPEGRCIDEVGVQPDLTIEEKKIEGWELAERHKLDRSLVVWDYVSKRYEVHKDRFHKLAVSDENDISLYPDFEEFYKSLNTMLDRDRIRQIIRANIRKKIFDETGKELVTDIQEDIQLQAGILKLLEQLSIEPDSIPEYKGLKEAVAQHVKKDKDTDSPPNHPEHGTPENKTEEGNDTY